MTRKSIHSLLCVLATVLTVACSSGPAEQTEITRSVRDGLTTTISLTAPGSVSPIAPVLNGSNSLSVGAAAEIVQGLSVAMGTAGLQTQPDALLNETWSRGTAVLRDRVKVRGTLHARTRNNGTGVSVALWDQNPAFDPVTTLSWKVTYPPGTASDVLLNSGESKTLAPGLYGTLTLNSQSTLTLQSGSYFLTGLSLQSTSVVKLNQANGPVIIYVINPFIVRGSFAPLSGTDPDLLIVALSTQPVYVESLFNGALIAPFASLTLRSVSGVHSGFFYAKDASLDAGAKVRYRAPTALVAAPGTGGPSCQALAALAQIPKDSLFKYCKGCDTPRDSDRDGFEDCVDGCDFDALKSVAGVCGCGVPDTDSDGDGTPDCLDLCDLDPNNVTPGQCGCLSSHKNVLPRQAAGALCTETACPSTGTQTCNGAGVCGNRSSCNPGGCRFVEYARNSYWVCSGPATESAAANACRSRRMALARIDNFSENDFLRKIVTRPVWIGANSLTTSGAWRWATAVDNNGEQFWSGNASGSQSNSLFSSWASGAPAAQSCAVIRPGDGRWLDVDCNEALGFICEFDIPNSPLPPPGSMVPPQGDPGQPASPMPSSCVSTANAFLPPEHDPPDFNGILEFVPVQRAADQGTFQGPAQRPPAPNTPQSCTAPDRSSALGTSDGTAGCTLNIVANEPANFHCMEEADCAQFGSNLVCRQVQDDPSCVPIDENHLCVAHSHCGTLVCPPPPAGTTSCDTIDVCDPGSEISADNNGQDLTPELFDPRHLFPGNALPNVQPAASYQDDPEPGIHGKDHKWCFMDAQHPIPEATQAANNKVGQANGASKLKFSFNPNLEFHAHVNPLAAGETDLDVHARASLTTHIQLKGFIGADFERDVLSAAADIAVHRCTLRTDDTEFSVFGADFLDLVDVPRFDTSDPKQDTILDDDTHWEPFTNRCNRAVGKFVDAANRAKKAFRDAQQLLSQYKSLKAASKNFSSLCENVVGIVGAGGVDVPGFPDGLTCPANEPAEITINRFLDYYQAPGFGQVSKLHDSVKELSDATNNLFKGLNRTWSFGPKPMGESRTIVRAQFQIGPVPAMLEISAFYSYGVNGYFEASLTPPFNPFEDPPDGQAQRNPIAKVRAGVMPYASAGLSLFVGAGRSLGPFNASLGIEGSVKLATLRVPIFAGAGLGAEVQSDNRAFASDIAPLVATTGLPTHLGIPKSFKFFAWYEYGASLAVSDILSGEINGRLRIKFAFFSRTWRKRIVKFNGLSDFTVQLVSGKGGNDPGVNRGTGAVDFKKKDGTQATATANLVEGTSDMGLSEAQVPLLVLTPLEPPSATPAPDPSDQAFDARAVEGMFYDNLCCAKPGDPVPDGVSQCVLPGGRPSRGGAVPCCPGFRCAPDPDNGSRCVFDCRKQNEQCADVSQCCPVDNHDVSCGSDGLCHQCGHVGQNGMGAACTQSADCCGADSDPLIACGADHTCTRLCHEDPGPSCTSNADCCASSALQCGQNGAGPTCCGTASGSPGSGGRCKKDADCCGFGPNSNVGCFPRANSTEGECLIVVP